MAWVRRLWLGVRWRGCYSEEESPAINGEGGSKVMEERERGGGKERCAVIERGQGKAEVLGHEEGGEHGGGKKKRKMMGSAGARVGPKAHHSSFDDE